VIDDSPVRQKIHGALQVFGVSPVTATAAAARFLGADEDESADGPALTVAALYTLYTERMTDLYPRVTELLDTARDPFVRETADWIAEQLDIPRRCPSG